MNIYIYMYIYTFECIYIYSYSYHRHTTHIYAPEKSYVYTYLQRINSSVNQYANVLASRKLEGRLFEFRR